MLITSYVAALTTRDEARIAIFAHDALVIVTTFGAEKKYNVVATRWLKIIIEGIFTRFDRIHERDIDGQTPGDGI